MTSTDDDRPTDGPATPPGPGAGAGAPPPPPPPPPYAEPTPRLRRRTDDKIIAGVASGLAAYLRVDPALVRIGFVVLLFMGGIGVPLYVAAWLLVPAADEEEAQAAQLIDQRGPAFWVGVGILVLVAFAVADEVLFAGRTSWWPLVLIAAGVALWRVGQKDGERRAADQSSASAAGVTGAARADVASVGAVRAQEGAMSTTTTPVREYTPPPVPSRRPRPVDYTPPPAEPKEPSFLGRLTVALAFIAAGVTVILDRVSPAIDAGFGEILAVVLVTIGAGLLVGTWFGRARWLILVGLLLTPVVIAASVIGRFDIPLSGGVGERYVFVTTAEQAEQASYDLAFGSLRIDLSEYASELPPDPIVAEVGAGEIVVSVPAGAALEITADVGIGEIDLLGEQSDGPDLRRTLSRSGDGPTLVLNLDVGAGSIRVEEAAVATTDDAQASSDALTLEVQP